MIRTLRAFFLARLLREKILLVALAVILAGLWASSLSGRALHFWGERKHTQAALAQQAHWLNSRLRVQAAAQQAASGFDPAKTLDSTRLLAAIGAVANDAGLKNYTSGESQDVSNGQFSVHALQFSVSKVEWGALKAFYYGLHAHSPYIGIEQCAVARDRANTTLLDVSMKISSVEILHGP